MAILDEVHHAGDSKSWGTGVTDAFDTAAIRFLLTGTPFRSDDAKIAHVRYEPVGDDGAVQSVADYTYGYGEALRDGVVRPVLFATYGADATWQTAAGEVERAMLGDADLSNDAEEAAWRTALDPGGEWIPHVFSAALRRVEHLRRTTIPDAKVIIPASNQQTAREYAAVWRRVTGLDAAVVLSDDAESSSKIAAFRDDPAQVAIVCVRMVTEGVDIKPAAVLVWSTTASTPLFFRQMVGRVIRARNRTERATVFLPRVRRLMALAAAMELERDHIIGPPEQPVDLDADPAMLDEPDGEPEAGEKWRPIGSAASLHDVFIPADADLVGLPGLLTREQERELLTRYDQENREAARESVRAAAKEAARAEAAAEEARLAWLRGTGPRPDHVPEPTEMRAASHSTMSQLRREIANLIHGYAARKGVPHAEAWSVLYRKAPGPKNPSADLALLRRRLDVARDL